MPKHVHPCVHIQEGTQPLKSFKRRNHLALLSIFLFLGFMCVSATSIETAEAGPKTIGVSEASEQSVRYSTGVSYQSGYSKSGTHVDTHSSNNVYHKSRGRFLNIIPWGQTSIEAARGDYYGTWFLMVTYTFNTGGVDRFRVSMIEVEGEARTNYESYDGFTVHLSIYNVKKSRWNSCGYFVGTTSDTEIAWSNMVSPSDYIDSSGNMKLQWTFASCDFSELWIDFQCIKLTMRQWTFIVYLDADNNLDSAGVDDLNEMEMVGSTPDVTTIVQIDRYYNWADQANHNARRYFATRDTNPSTITSVMLQDVGEVNMGDPLTLVNFVEWTMNNYRALRYCLVLWDHGGGFLGVCWDDHSGGDCITMNELETALDTITTETDETIDVLGFDACLMELTEVGYQIRNYAMTMVGSEEYEPWDGWPYDLILDDLVNDPGMWQIELCRKIVQAYGEYYDGWSYLTLSAIDLTKMNSFALKVDDFALCLIDALPTLRDIIETCRGQTEEYYYTFYVDFYHFAQLVWNNGICRDSATQVMEGITDMVIEEWHGSQHPNSHGLSIYFPETWGQYYSVYDTLDLSVDCHWDEFLKAYLD